MTILVCDDDKEIVEAIEIYLMQEGYNVEKAYDGIQAVEIMKNKNNKAVIVDFSAEWCGPCKMLAPVMEQLSDEITDVEFYNIDVDENPDLAREYRIMNIPAVIAIKGGQVAGQQIGLVSKDDMKGFIDGVF